MWKSCVYKLTIDNETYVGSTGNFKKRLTNHKSDCYNPDSKEYNKSLYKYIRENSEWNNVKFEVLVHLHPKFNRGERCNFEQQYIDYLKPTLNKYKAYTVITKKEYNKQYIIENKDKFSEKFNCDCGVKYTHSHKSRHLKSKKHLKYMDTE